MRSWGSIDEKIRFRDKVKVLDTFFFGKIRLLVRKLGTMLSYFRMGFSLGRNLRSKVLLSTALLHYKLMPKSSFLYTVHLKDYGVICFRPGDIGEIYDIIWREDYWFKEMQEADFNVVLDLGAHIGLFTLWVKSKFLKATVHCYEPDPYSYSLLQRNTQALNGVVLHQEAVGVSSGEAMFFIDFRRHALSSFRESQGKKPISCSVKALDDVIDALGRVDLVKFDIEGLEYEVFSKSSKVQDVNHLVGEVHGKAVDVNRFLDLFPGHCKHVRIYSDCMYIVYLHKKASGVCGS